MIGPDAVAQCRWLEPGGTPAAQAICAFVQEIGIEVRIAPIAERTFVPGMDVHQGCLRIDPAVAAYPGDLLHEAGHIAVIEQPRRAAVSDVGTDPAEEMAAIAWSVAAARACGVPLPVLFHPDGYRGGSQALIDAFEGDGSVGTPLLAWWGMTVAPNPGRGPVPGAFPAMSRWLR